MKTKKELIKTIMICRDALESCCDNYGSEASDNGEYEESYDGELIDKARTRIRLHQFTKKEEGKE